MVAVQNAPKAFGLVVLAEDFDSGDTDRARHLQNFGARHKLIAVGEAEKIHLELDGDPIRPLGRLEVTAMPAA